MRILIAPDKFKGTLSAPEVAENIAKGLRDVLSEPEIKCLPMADGGEGTADVLCNGLGGSWIKCRSHDPLGREIKARYGWIRDTSLGPGRHNLAVMEMSEAAGMWRLPETERDPLRASTFGVGEMLLDAVARGADQIVIGLGGSATNDAGFGMAQALGFRFLKSEPHSNLDRFNQSSLQGTSQLRPETGELVDLDRIEKPARLKLPMIIAAVDVRNPLLGENGATRVFGPQKGASEEKIGKLECALTRLADVVAKEFGFDYRNEPGAGAAGGLGFGLMSFCNATIRPGFEVVADSVGLESKVRDVDLVITGEGSLDRQTLEGKTAAGVAQLARRFRKPVYALVGRAVGDEEVSKLFTGVYQNARPGMSREENMHRAAELLRENARELGKVLNKTPNAPRPRSGIQ